MATTEEETNKAQFRRTYEEMFHQGNLAVADELIAPDCINHEVPPGMNNRGPEGIRQVVMMLRTAFPDLHGTIEEYVLSSLASFLHSIDNLTIMPFGLTF